MNKLDIYRSAEQAAEDSLACKNQFEIDQFAQSQFTGQGLDQRDYEFWIQIYRQQRQLFEQFAKMKAASVKPQTT